MSKSNTCTLKTIKTIYNPLVELPEAEQAFYSERSIILKYDIVGDILDGCRKIFIMPTICTTDTITPDMEFIEIDDFGLHVDQEMITCRTAKIDRYREVFRKSVENHLIKDLDRIDQILPDMQKSERSKLASFVQRILSDKSAGHWRFVKLYDNRNDDMPCYGVVFLFTYKKIRCAYSWDTEKTSFEFYSVMQDDDIEAERYISMDDIPWLDNPKLKQDRPQKDWLDRKLKKSLYG